MKTHSQPQALDARALDIAHWVNAHIEQIARESTHLIWEEVAAYRETPLFEDVVHHVGEIFEVFTSTVLQGRSPQAADFPFTSGHATLRVEHGISLVDFLKAFRIAQLALWRAIRGHTVADGAEEATALGLVEHLMRTIEAGSTAAAITYLNAQQYLVADKERLARECLEDLLAGRPPASAVRANALRSAGLEDGSPYAVVVCRPGADTDPARLGVEAHRVLSHSLPGMLAMWRQMLVCLVPLAGQSPTMLAERLERPAEELRAADAVISAGVSSAHTRLEQAASALREAELACDHLLPSGGVQAFEALSPLDYLVASSDAAADRLIEPRVRAYLLDDLASGAVYVDTVRAYLDGDMNAKVAAASLHIHVNTMHYRIAQILERTGLDLRRFEDATQLLLAVRLLEGR